ncbi:endophilin-A3 isoform X2 [Dromiciops gliroides]|uniref:endophilin-A3 isoform X2 n=1 Tax=Dromiciops gliroides TaxID=33562 RepID=UPI001CC4A618|nr:endophilin-A3 isoform X2 [Dromiciops gliroides]
MSVSGLKKQFHKASQKIDVTSKAIVDLLAKCTEYLQPNPACRMKLGMQNTMSRITGQVITAGYPQPEGLLGDSMLRYGNELGEDSMFGQALLDFGESMKLIAEVKDYLDITVKQNFIDPLQLLQEKDLKEVAYHLKKLEGRRLDYDYKKRRVSRISREELLSAVRKFEESKEVTRKGMCNLLENDIEQVSQLLAFVEAVLAYHKQSAEILQELHRKLQHRIRISTTFCNYNYKPETEFNTLRFGNVCKEIPFPSPVKTGPAILSDQPCCRALYDFVPESEGELGFKEGDIITLTSQIDENWYEGIFEGQSGFFPINYVSVLVPLSY